MSADPIIYCLERLTDYRQFERLCCDLMAGCGYRDIDPMGGSADRGRDALHHDKSTDGPTIFAFTVRADWHRKLLQDCERIREEGHGLSQLVFVCASALSTEVKDNASTLIRDRFGWPLKIYDLERIRVLLSGELRHLVAQHPAIFCPPWFPQRGGLSLAEAADTLVIDHLDADHALATWLGRRLSLAGFQTWCYGTAPLAGEDADASVRLLIQRRALQYLPVLSPDSLADRNFMDRCGAASLRDGLLLPCWAASIEELLEGTRLGRVEPARFHDSWSAGLKAALESLKSKGIAASYDAERGRSIALRAYLPEPVTKAAPERVFANAFRATVPKSVLVYDLARELPTDALNELRRTWAFVIADPLKYLAFHEPPIALPLLTRSRPPEYAWENYDEHEGKKSVDAVKELLRRSLDVACVRAGLTWCDDRRVFYFPQTDGVQRNVSLDHVDGRHTRVAMTGERQYGWGERASQFRYQLGPMFRPGRDEAGDWWITARIYVRVTDLAGVPFQLKDITRRRKAVTKNWWNKEWLARLLGMMQALRSEGSEIQIGSGRRAVTVSTVPMEWACPISIDLAAMARIGNFQEEMAAMRFTDDEEEEDEDSDPAAEEQADE